MGSVSRSDGASDVLRKRTVGPLDQPAISAAETVPRSAVRGWRRACDNHIGSKLKIPIVLQSDVAPRKTWAGPAGPHSSCRHDRSSQEHRCTAAPAGSADAWCMWWRGAATRSWRASCRAACISAASTAAVQMRGSCRAFGSVRGRRPTSCSLKSLINAGVNDCSCPCVRALVVVVGVLSRNNEWWNESVRVFFQGEPAKIKLFRKAL